MTKKNIVKQYGIEMERVGHLHYRATNPQGVSVDYGRGEGLMTPIELLLAAVAGCSSVDVDMVTSRRSEPQKFRVSVEADRVDEDGAARLSDVRVAFDISFPDTEEGRQAQSMIERLVRISHEKDCTASRTVELPTNVEFEVVKN